MMKLVLLVLLRDLCRRHRHLDYKDIGAPLVVTRAFTRSDNYSAEYAGSRSVY